MGALDRPPCDPSRSRDDGKLQDRLRAWHGKTGKSPAASHFATSGAANHEPATVLTSLMGQECCITYTIRIGGDELLPQEPSDVEEGSGEGLWAAGRVVCT